MENYVALSDTQTKVFHDAELASQAYRNVLRAFAPYQGWMYFKKVGAREYLFHAIDRTNNGKSMGARSDETEAKLAEWLAAKADAEQAFARAAAALEEQRRFCRAARLGRLDKTAAKLLRLIEQAGMAERFIVVGTHALHAYEAMAGVHFISDLTATKDFDILWDAGQRIALLDTTEKSDPAPGLMAILKKVDKTFTRNEERTFQALNASGFAVEVLRPEQPREPALIGANDQINPIHVAGQDDLIATGAISETVIAEDGYPILIRVPDPAAFVLHKLWVAKQKDRRKDKAARDQRQALALAQLIRERIQFYGFDVDRIQNFPPRLLDQLAEVEAM
jgi:hypothetical protein